MPREIVQRGFIPGSGQQRISALLSANLLAFGNQSRMTSLCRQGYPDVTRTPTQFSSHPGATFALLSGSQAGSGHSSNNNSKGAALA